MEEKREFHPVPEGDYTASLKEAKIMPFSNGSGRKVRLQFIVNYKDKNYSVFHELPMKHTNSEWVKNFGHRGADLLLKAFGSSLEEQDNDMLNLVDFAGKECVIAVKIEEAEEYIDKAGNKKMSKARNKIVTFKAI